MATSERGINGCHASLSLKQAFDFARSENIRP